MTLGKSAVTIRQGETLDIAVATSVLNGFRSAIALSVNGLPKGVTASLARTTILSPGNGSATLNLKVASATGSKVGTYSLTVTGAGGGVIQTQKLTLKISS
jgi:uncharacterized membrane protein